MSNNASNNNAFALKDILLALADGLNDAQEELRSVPPFDEQGRPNTLYQLPYLDFGLQVISKFEQETTTTQTTTSNNALARRGRLRFAVTPAKEEDVVQTTEVFSKISGRFTAVVPNDGLPQLVINVTLDEPKAINAYSARIGVNISVENTSGETVEGAKVELNFDAESTNAVNGSAFAATKLPSFDPAEAYTDPNGQCRTDLKVPRDVSYQVVVFTVSSGLSNQSISVKKPTL